MTYALAIYLLNLFIAFISPKFDPASEDYDDETGIIIIIIVIMVYNIIIIFKKVHHYLPNPMKSSNLSSGDYQSLNFGETFIQTDVSKKYQLHRFSMTRAVLIAMICTFFSMFNIPVFWPILVLYFIILFAITMKKQIKVCELAKK